MRALEAPYPIRISPGNATLAHSLFAARGDHGLLVLHIKVLHANEAIDRVNLVVILLLLFIFFLHIIIGISLITSPLLLNLGLWWEVGRRLKVKSRL